MSKTRAKVREALDTPRPSVRLPRPGRNHAWHFIASDDGETVRTRCGRVLPAEGLRRDERTFRDGYKCDPCGWDVLREMDLI